MQQDEEMGGKGLALPDGQGEVTVARYHVWKKRSEKGRRRRGKNPEQEPAAALKRIFITGNCTIAIIACQSQMYCGGGGKGSKRGPKCWSR